MYVNVGFVRGFIPYYEWYSYSMGRLQVEIVLIQIYVICIWFLKGFIPIPRTKGIRRGGNWVKSYVYVGFVRGGIPIPREDCEWRGGNYGDFGNK